MSDILERIRREPTCSPEDAFEVLGCGRTAGYEALRTRTFPVPVLRVGRRWRVPTAPLLRAVGADDDTTVNAKSPAQTGPRRIEQHRGSG